MRPLAFAFAFALLTATPALAAPPAPEASIKKELGDTRRDAGDNTGALAAYREALQISPGYIEVWEEIGKLYFGVKKFGEAAEAFQRAVDIDASFANNWFNLALASRRAGDPSRSRDAFRRYLALKPEDFEARLRLADVLKQLGERDAALKEYQAVLEASEARTVTPAIGEKAREAIALLRAAQPEAAAASPALSAPPAAPPALPPAAPPAAPPVVIQPVAPPTPAPTVIIQPVAPPAPPVVAPAVAAAPPSPALLDKLALGDRLQNAGDYRGALFAFQDAVYLDPRHAVARVKLGRAYWILRYVGQAEEQWLQASTLAPNDPSIAHMIEEARKAPRPAPAGAPEPAPVGQPGSGAPGPSGAGMGAPAGAPAGGPRIYKFVPEGGAEPAPVSPTGGSTPGYGMPPAPAQGYPQQGGQPQYGQPQYAPPAQYPPQYAQPQYAPPQYPPAQQYPPPQQYPQPQYGQPQYAQPQYGQPPAAQGYGQPQYGQPAPGPSPAPAQPGYAPAPEPQPPLVPASVGAAAQRYRAALSLYTQRDYLGAIAELDAAITLDPNLAVAYVARGSARFGLGKYRQAAADYKAALDLDPARAEPVWGLAECQRMLHDPAAPETYRRYAASVSSDVNEDRRAKARRWAAELTPPPQAP
jgi:tetratricopeptide (TPR) repeat protein